MKKQPSLHQILSIVGFAVIARGALAQAPCDSTAVLRETALTGVGNDYTRLIELTSRKNLVPRLARRLSNSGTHSCLPVGPWATGAGYQVRHSGLAVAPLSIAVGHNSTYPEDRNNGVLWSGRGISTSLSGGAILHVGRLSIAALPVVSYQQNRDYQTLPPVVAANSIYANGLYSPLDIPQRFGPDGYSTFDWGQSFVRLDAWNVGAGISNENIWWGPGISNAILFTNTAPGFPHLFLNLRRPVNVGIGSLTAETMWGRLTESEYFDTVSTNNHRMIVGALLTLQPGWVRGLYLGVGRTFAIPWDSISARNLFPLGQTFWKRDLTTPENPTGSSNDDQRVSIMARYVLPESGFEIYGEWAREDHSWDKSDFIQEPEHSAGHVIGAQKLFTPRPARWVRAYAEATNLQSLRQSRPAIRGTPSFYTFPQPGHTQLGQLLGASIGPGGESQLAGIDVISSMGLVGGYFERVRRDEFSSRGVAAWSSTWPPRHDVAITLGLRTTRWIRGLRLDADFARSKRYNRNFIRHEFNSQLHFRASWFAPHASRPSLSVPTLPAGGASSGAP